MQDHGVYRVGLLQLKQKLFHGLDGVVPTQVDYHLLNLREREREKTKTTDLGWLRGRSLCV